MRRISSMRWARPGKLPERSGKLVPGEAQAARGGQRGACILGVVRASSEPIPASWRGLNDAIRHLEQLGAFGVDAGPNRMTCRNPDGVDAPRDSPRRDGVAKAVVRADHRLRAACAENLLLHGRVVLKGAMAVEMIGRDVEQDRGVRDRGLASGRSG